MNRRGFIGALLGAAVLDSERLLWVPGKKVYSIPPPAPVSGVEIMHLFREAYLRPAMDQIANQIDRELLDYYKYRCAVGTGWIQPPEHRVYIAS